MRYWLVMPAAGAGRRFSDRIPKQYARLYGRTVLEWALAPFVADPRCAGIALALARDDSHWPEVAKRLPAVTVAPGGRERFESVQNALACLSRRAAEADWVLVHDAARPCLTTQDLDKLITRLASHPVGGLLAAPAADTLKSAQTDGCVDRTIDRTGLWRALTPQMFRYRRLREALDHARAANRVPTDEAQAIEWLGEHPMLVEGSPRNIKVTSSDDLSLAEALLAAQAASHETSTRGEGT